MTDCDNLFPGDSYDTPEHVPHALMDYLTGYGRWYFYWKNFNIFRRTGKCGCRGRLDQARQIAFSNGNVKLVESVGGKIHLRGLQYLRERRGRPAVLVGNHMSLLETALFHAILRPHIDFTFVIKESLFDVPWFGDIMRTLEAIPVKRDNPRDDFKTVLTLGKERLARGKSVLLFPQGTRSEELVPGHFNTIGIKLARAAGVDILPFALKTDFLATGKLIRDMGPVRRKRHIWFEFGPPAPVEGSGKEQHEAVIAFIADRLKQWYALEGRPAPVREEAEVPAQE